MGPSRARAQREQQGRQAQPASSCIGLPPGRRWAGRFPRAPWSERWSGSALRRTPCSPAAPPLPAAACDAETAQPMPLTHRRPLLTRPPTVSQTNLSHQPVHGFELARSCSYRCAAPRPDLEPPPEPCALARPFARPADPFADAGAVPGGGTDPFADAEADNQQKDLIHIRVQQRNGRKCITTVQVRHLGIPPSPSFFCLLLPPSAPPLPPSLASFCLLSPCAPIRPHPPPSPCRASTSMLDSQEDNPDPTPTPNSNQGLDQQLDLKKIIKTIKKAHCCNGTMVEDEEMGQVG